MSQRKGDRREFNNIGEMRWSGRSWIYSLGSMDRPSITPGRSADEAWAPASEKGYRQLDTGMLAEVR